MRNKFSFTISVIIPKILALYIPQLVTQIMHSEVTAVLLSELK